MALLDTQHKAGLNNRRDASHAACYLAVNAQYHIFKKHINLEAKWDCTIGNIFYQMDNTEEYIMNRLKVSCTLQSFWEALAKVRYLPFAIYCAGQAGRKKNTTKK